MTEDYAAKRFDLIEDWGTEEVDPQRFASVQIVGDRMIFSGESDAAVLASDTTVEIRR